MLQRIIGHLVGGVVIFLALLLFVGGKVIPDTNTAYIVSIVIGMLCSFFWPIVIAFWLARRVKAKRENEVQAEVERQMAAQQKKPGG
jgi:preprotein translocase subunit SecF